MGMDISGRKPRNETGVYFRNNIWWWSPLWDYCVTVAPELCGKVKYAYTNDGDGLGARDSSKLATLLLKEVTEGRTKQYEQDLKDKTDRIPLISCNICAGTGKRLPPPNVGAGTNPCNGCDAKGRVKPWNATRPFSVENVIEFAAFLKNSGGFNIW